MKNVKNAFMNEYNAFILGIRESYVILWWERNITKIEWIWRWIKQCWKNIIIVIYNIHVVSHIYYAVIDYYIFISITHLLCIVELTSNIYIYYTEVI